MSTAAENQFKYEGEPVRCHGCGATQRMMTKFAKEGGDTAGILVRMTRKPGG